jgi:hypothetical protein
MRGSIIEVLLYDFRGIAVALQGGSYNSYGNTNCTGHKIAIFSEQPPVRLAGLTTSAQTLLLYQKGSFLILSARA